MVDKKPRFKRFLRHGVSGLIFLSAIGLAVLMSMARKGAETKDGDNFQQTVSVFNAMDYEGKLEFDVSGVVEPHREVEISSQVAGVVDKRADNCRAGMFVKKDTPLLWIDSSNYDLTKERLQAEKNQAESSIRELDRELEGLNDSIRLAEKEYELQRKETERRIGAGSAMSRTELDQSRRALNSAEQALTQLKNSRRLAESRRVRLESGIKLSDVRLREAELDITRCMIKAPFDGVVVSDMVEEGDFVSVGKNVLVFEDTSAADVKCNLRVEQLAQIVKYQSTDSRAQTNPAFAYQLPPTPVTVTREVDGNITSWPGTLSRFDGIGVDNQTKMIPCRVVVENPLTINERSSTGLPKALVRGMFVNVTVELNSAEFGDEVLLQFPAIALRPGNFVWSVVDGKLKRHKVVIINRINSEDPDPRKRSVVALANRTELSAKSAIVTSPLTQPLPGSTVKIISTFEADTDPEATAEDNPDTTGDTKNTTTRRPASDKDETDSSAAVKTNKTELIRS